MNISTIKNAVTSKAALTLLKGQKHSPTILFGAGVIGVIGTTILAARATLKLEEVLEETQTNLAMVKKVVATKNPKYTEEDSKRDVVIVYTQGALKVARLYWPSIALGAASIAMLAGSHNILNKRNAAITAAYASVKRGFDDYRKRVVAEIGPDAERRLRHGIEEREIIEETETGPQPRIVQSASKHGHSPYARFFSKENAPSTFQQRADYNLTFLQAHQNMANHRLESRGYVLLNDIFDGLGMERTPEGCVVGWLRDEKHGGDGYISFGIFDDDAKFYDFMVGNENAILLDFNVDGIIYEKI